MCNFGHRRLGVAFAGSGRDNSIGPPATPEVSRMICPHCGKGTSARQSRCSACGRAVSVVGTSVLTPPPPDFFKTPVPDPNDMTRAPGAGESFPSAGPLAIGQTFGARYRIVKMLGIGGMG